MQPEENSSEKQMIFFPNFLFIEAIAALVVFVILVALTVFYPVGMGDPADPSASAFKPKPEWYFMAPYFLLKLVPSSLEVLPAVIAPAVGGLFLMAMPFLDKNPERRPSKRPITMAITVLATLGLIGFTIAGIVIE
jgi:menaquinol-cytochrome c reductase cytochrome b/c subunit